MTQNEYLSISQIANNPAYPFTMGQLRYYLIRRHKNGLEVAVRKIHKRLYLQQRSI